MFVKCLEESDTVEPHPLRGENVHPCHEIRVSWGMQTTPEHEALLTRARAGDLPALVELLDDVGQEVRRRIAHKVSPQWRAILDEDDVMQTTYLEAVTRFEKFSTGNAKDFVSWLSRLAENNLIDGVRALEAAKRPDPSKRVTRRANSSDSATSLVTVLGITFTTPSMNAARGEAGGYLMKVIEQLPDVYCRVVKLYDLEGKSIEEVAAELGRSQGAVYMLRARAHEQLKELLGRESRYFSVK